VRWLNSPNYDYLKLKKEEVIYKRSVCTNTRVLLLYTAYASRASARDHVTWNASDRTVTLLKSKNYYNNTKESILVL
jgi:hypothetical protein